MASASAPPPPKVLRVRRQVTLHAGQRFYLAEVLVGLGVTAGHLIRQRVLTEAKRALVFTGQPIHEISYDLGFADPSNFARFFRKQTAMTPQDA